MLPLIEAAVEALEAAQESSSKHISLTDSDAQMMKEGREKHIKECHMFEVAVDGEARLLVAAQSCQSQADNPRLTGLVELAKLHEPGGVVQVDADSGYYTGEGIAALIKSGIATCIPDSNIAGDESLSTDHDAYLRGAPMVSKSQL